MSETNIENQTNGLDEELRGLAESIVLLQETAQGLVDVREMGATITEEIDEIARERKAMMERYDAAEKESARKKTKAVVGKVADVAISAGIGAGIFALLPSPTFGAAEGAVYTSGYSLASKLTHTALGKIPLASAIVGTGIGLVSQNLEKGVVSGAAFAVCLTAIEGGKKLYNVLKERHDFHKVRGTVRAYERDENGKFIV